ncbi:hypothetical protein GOP47_0006046 [Adiantum capillus-veneris]|uniref:HECT-type E3 ubiquitin transferase n=1 Tax=Adiantum capillus-veneris TaxID=13818 RepID=A0A9D4V241_ADICA|nr:hypothetical protein GOP47_0006046 [Adiantum capillus-veneris]
MATHVCARRRHRSSSHLKPTIVLIFLDNGFKRLVESPRSCDFFLVFFKLGSQKSWIMFFSGEPSTRKKVDLGGRSSKERDRSKLLEQARIERENRQRVRLETQSAIKLQKVFRGRKIIAVERQEIRKQFCTVYGEFGESANVNAFKESSKYLPQVLFFFQLKDRTDLQRLAGVCRILHRCLFESGSLVALFSTGDSLPNLHIVELRIKKLCLLCLQAVHYYREYISKELLEPVTERSLSDNVAILLLQTVLTLSDKNAPWAGMVIDFLYKKRLFSIFRDLLQTVSSSLGHYGGTSCLEHALVSLTLRHVEEGQSSISLESWSFATQILSFPLIFQRFSYLRQVFISKGIWAFSIRQLASSLQDFVKLLPTNTSVQFPANVCLLGNLLEISGSALRVQECPWELAVYFASISRCLIEELPPAYRTFSEDSVEAPEVMMDEEGPPVTEKSLEDQLLYASKGDILKHMVRLAFSDALKAPGMRVGPPSVREAEAIGEVCMFLHATLLFTPSTEVFTSLAYSTRIVSHLWSYIERCHAAHEWPIVKLQGKNAIEQHPISDVDGMLLPLLVFCPAYSFMLFSIDNEEFYEQQKPLRLEDIKLLVLILKEALWQILWVLPIKSATGNASAVVKYETSHEGFSIKYLKHMVSKSTSRLLQQLQDWNSRRQFMSPQAFNAREAMDEIFFSQVEKENSRAYDLLVQAPFLIPFTHRVRIYTTQLSSAKEQYNVPSLFPRMRIRVRRDRIVEDAFAALNTLPEEALQGLIRVTFVNEFGVEEAGVDGGGLFKDFMESITKAAFDIQYGLFKETPDHLLYPNPASHMVHDEHLQYFMFLGKILGKAMFEGILVDIPFATFFLSKLKKKHNFLHDLSSLDPELYRSLLFLKHYEEDWTQLGLYFVIENNEYGEQVEEELIPGGKDIQVSKDNVIKYIHHVANYRLNKQIRQQSSHFLRGFQQLIQTKWIDMFNEHELQLLISGSLEGLNVDDLRLNANYSGGYSENHPVIDMFWEIIKTLDSGLQQKFLKFVTGCSRGPLLGFKYLEPQFCIQRAAPEDVSDDMLDRLPTSATCMNLLKLPPYKRKDILKAKLLYAITADAGFDLS